MVNVPDGIHTIPSGAFSPLTHDPELSKKKARTAPEAISPPQISNGREGKDILIRIRQRGKNTKAKIS
jgi:hypothetical protein